VEPGARGEWAKETWVAVNGLQPGAVVIKGHVGPLRPGSAVKFTAGALAAPGAPKTAP